MITFQITVKEGPAGKVHFRMETPAGKATINEQRMAREFMMNVQRFHITSGTVKVTRPWKDTNNPNRQ